ncbi:hypothetical protein KFE25_012014 [Diacronema lutheri]|uniref:Uncharacterized protein n=2 Tax=Diacronema lutheri TaxID=2081491 RepID=A0A8J5X7M0_DIALT|nr:hypothetical protein KFE25_012014 [Diacronema lutheri]
MYSQPPAYPTGGAPAAQMYNVVVPPGVQPGDTFQANVNGVLMNVVSPPGVSSGMEVQIPGPPPSSGAPPLPSGYPQAVYPPHHPHGAAAGYAGATSTGGVGGSSSMGYSGGGSGGGYPAGGASYGGQGVVYTSQVPMVEESVISPLGWFICIVGCFICPPCNLFGLCLQERRLVPASRV